MRKKEVQQLSPDGIQYRRSSTGDIILAQCSYMAYALFATLMTYASYMASAGYGIATAVVGVILTGITIFDGITDPIAARIIDNFNTKHGKIRILLWIGFAISTAALILMYFVLSTGKLGIITFIIIDAIFYIGFTVFCVTQQTIPPVMTNDPKQRPQISMWGTIVGIFPPIILVIYNSAVLLPKYGNEYTVPMLREMCLTVIIAAAFALVLSMIGLRKCDKPENFKGLHAEQEKVSFGDMVSMFKENKALQSYFFAAASDRLAGSVAGQSVVTTLVAGILYRNMAKYSTISLIPMVIGMVALVFCAKANGNMGSKRGIKFWSAIGIGLSAVEFAYMCFLMMNGKLDKVLSTGILIVLYILFTAVRSVINNGNGNATNMMMADVIDYQCYLTGKYMPAAVTATYSFLDKAISSLGSTICLGLLALIGYHSTLPQPTDEATAKIFFVAMFINIGLPCIGWIINVISMRFNPLTKEMMVEVQRTITDKKSELEAEL